MTQIYTVRPHAESYGHDVGILMLDCRTPFVPGDVGNVNSYRYPVLYLTVPGLTLQRVIDEGDLGFTDVIVQHAQKLEAHGVKAITSDCGYMLWFQDSVAQAVSIPVMLSPLLQLPFVASGIRIIGLKQGYKRPASISRTSVDMSAP